MGTYLEIKLPKNLPLNTRNSNFNFIFSISENLEKILSTYDKSSEVSQINKSNLTSIKNVSPELIELLSISKKICLITDGYFDPTIKPLVDLWNTSLEKNRIPIIHEIEKMKKKIGCNKYSVYPKSHKLVKNSNLKFNFGGIGKGYAIDKMIDYIKSSTIEFGIINFGGQIYVHDRFNKIQIDPIKVYDPKNYNKVLFTYKLKNKSISTSSNEQKYQTVGGVRYSHIISPLTGYPINSSTNLVTVIHESGAISDSLSTAIFVNRTIGFKNKQKILDSDIFIKFSEIFFYNSQIFQISGTNK